MHADVDVDEQYFACAGTYLATEDCTPYLAVPLLESIFRFQTRSSHPPHPLPPFLATNCRAWPAFHGFECCLRIFELMSCEVLCVHLSVINALCSN
jgi:hypothetical protein